MGFWNNWPWSNFHELNLDWILQKIKELGTSIEGMVKSWNGRTGDVTLHADDVNQLAINAITTSATDPQTMAQAALKAIYDAGSRFIVYRNGSDNYVYALVYAESTGNVTLYDLGVTSFNNRTGAVSLTENDVNSLGIGLVNVLDPGETPNTLGADTLKKLYDAGIRLLVGSNNTNNAKMTNDRIWILENETTAVELNVSPMIRRAVATATESDYDALNESGIQAWMGNGVDKVVSNDYATNGKISFLFYSQTANAFGRITYQPVYSWNGKKGAVTLESNDLTDKAVKSFNGKQNDVTFTADDVNAFGINSIYQTDPGVNPAEYSQEDLKALYDNGYRIVLVPDNNGTYSGMYLLSLTSGKYYVDYYDASSKAPVQSVNGATGAVRFNYIRTIDGSDDLSGMAGVDDNVLAIFYPHYASGTNPQGKEIKGVKTFNGRDGAVTLTLNDVAKLDVPTVNVTSTTDADPSTFSQDELAKLYNNGTRILFVPTSTAGQYKLYFLERVLNSDQTTYTYSATLYDPAIGAGAVTSVNGKDGAVTLTASDVGAVTKNEIGELTTLTPIYADDSDTFTITRDNCYLIVNKSIKIASIGLTGYVSDSVQHTICTLPDNIHPIKASIYYQPYVGSEDLVGVYSCESTGTISVQISNNTRNRFWVLVTTFLYDDSVG